MMTVETTTITGPADLRDQRWLDERIDDLTAAADHVQDILIDIARNWSDGRNLARLHPGIAPADYIHDHVGHALGRDLIKPLLVESNWSNRQIAAVAGVSPDTVDRTARSQAVDRPAETLGADGKLRPGRVVKVVATAEVIEPDELVDGPDYWSELTTALAAIRRLNELDGPALTLEQVRRFGKRAKTQALAESIVHSIPASRRKAINREIRRHRVLGHVAYILETEEREERESPA